MLDLIKEAIKRSESQGNVYFINVNPVDDIPCEVVKSDAISFKSSSSLMMEAFREVSI